MISAQSRIHQIIDDMAAAAMLDIQMHATQERDRISVQVGWMIRSQGQIRRYAKAIDILPPPKGRGFLRRYTRASSPVVASVGSCFTERLTSATSPQANKRCPRSKILIAPTTSALFS